MAGGEFTLRPKIEIDGTELSADLARQVESCNAAGRRREGVRILGVNTAFDGVAVQRHRPGHNLAQAMSGGDQDLALHQV